MRGFEVYLSRPFGLVFIFRNNPPLRGWRFLHRFRAGTPRDFGRGREYLLLLHDEGWVKSEGSSRSGRVHGTRCGQLLWCLS
jgi:hypothetical protein